VLLPIPFYIVTMAVSLTVYDNIQRQRIV